MLQKVVLEHSDQQQILGIAMLIGGLAQHCTTSKYHLTIVRNFSQFSSTVHITTWAVLRDQFRQKLIHQKRRVGFRVVLFAVMGFYAVMTAHIAWNDIGKYPT